MTIRAGAELLEEHPVKDATFDKLKGLWSVNIENGKSFAVSYNRMVVSKLHKPLSTLLC